MHSENIKFLKENKFRILFYQLVEIIGLEIGLIICYFLITFNFLLFQSILILLFILFLSQKYRRAVISISFNEESGVIGFKLKSFLVIDSTIKISFSDISAEMKMKLLLTNYNKVFEIRDRDNVKIIIPYKNVLWTKNELEKIHSKIKEKMKP